MNEKELFNFTQALTVYRPKRQGVYSILESDWDRLKKMINRIPPHKRKYENLAYVLFGVTGSLLPSWVGFMFAAGLPAWVVPITGATTIFSVILGLALLHLDRQQIEGITSSAKNVLEDMRLIEETFERLPDETPEKETTAQQLSNRERDLVNRLRTKMKVLRSLPDDVLVNIAVQVNTGNKANAVHMLKKSAGDKLINPEGVIDSLSDYLSQIGF